MFEITDQPIVAVISPLHEYAGGVVSFEGRVRASNDGRDVIALEYEVYPALAVMEGENIIKEAKEKFSLLAAQAIHRQGKLQIGDTAVWVYTASMHRGESFEATRYIIDEIKHRVPIWKKEYYREGMTEWVRCHHHGNSKQ